jgi:glycosyltransferase involved in cell wall biosynthesis
VLGQTYDKFRLTILDNGSTDNSRSVLSSYLKDDRVRLKTNERNIRSVMGAEYMKKSSADYLSILFSDDYYEPDRLKIMLEAIGDYDAVFSNNNYVNEQGDGTPAPRYIATASEIETLSPLEHLRRFYVMGNSLHPCAMLVKTEAYRRFGGFPSYMHCMGDMYFFVRLLGGGRVRFICDRLQNITVWTNGRNESAGLHKNIMPSYLENMYLAELYAHEPLLALVGDVFGSHLASPNLTSDAERLWFLGVVTIELGQWEKLGHAFRCLYHALELDEVSMNKNVLNACGMTASEYVALLAARTALPTTVAAPIAMSTVTLRQYLRQFRFLHRSYRAVRSLGKALRRG